MCFTKDVLRKNLTLRDLRSLLLSNRGLKALGLWKLWFVTFKGSVSFLIPRGTLK